MKKNIGLYLAVGLVVLLAIIILIFGLFFLNDKDPREVFDTYYLRFPQVSTLTLDDPVKINGVKLGKVEDIYLSGHRVLVVVRIRNDVRIPVGSEIRVQNIGIMGERQIGIILCDSSENYSPNDTIDGQFDAGIAEALGLAGEIIDSTKTLITSVHQVMDSTIANPEFRTKFRTMMDKAENLEDRLAKMLKDTDPQIKSSLNNLNMATVKVNALLDTVKAPVSGLLADAGNLMQDAGGILVKLDSVTNRLTLLTSKLQSTDNTAGILLNDRTLHDDLVQTLHSADSLFQIIRQYGLDIIVDFFELGRMYCMLTKEIVVTNKLGVHARPAGMIVDITGKSQSDISLEYEGNKVNAKSILNVMMLAITPGSTVRFTADGADEEQVLNQLEQLFRENFHEEQND